MADEREVDNGRISGRTHSGDHNVCRSSADALPYVESSCERGHSLCLYHGIRCFRIVGGVGMVVKYILKKMVIGMLLLVCLGLCACGPESIELM